MLELDHLAVTAPSLQDGVDYIEQALGVTLAPGGAHAAMGTHNRLLRLGPRLYIEVIAIDPAAPAPGRPRWFGLDRSHRTGLTNWVLRSDALDDVLATVPLAHGTPMDLERGPYRWRMAVPDDGELPFNGASPALLEWNTDDHPADALPDAGCELQHLSVSHPKVEALLQAFPALEDLPRVTFSGGPLEIAATIGTPTGNWTLG